MTESPKLRPAPRHCRAVVTRAAKGYQASLRDQYGVFAFTGWKRSVPSARRAMRAYSRWRGWRLRWDERVEVLK